jgi:uncharacterized small protein (DUF1192 family)
MSCSLQKTAVPCLIPLLVLVLLAQPLAASGKVVKAEDLRQAIVEASDSRETDLASLREVLQSEPGREALALLGADSAKVEERAALLTDEELSRLAAQSEKIRNDFAAGQTGTVIALMAILLAVLAILIVAR